MVLPETLVEGVHYYFDPSGLMVFTEAYHLARGTCCGAGCRHCPYDHANVRPKAGRESPEED